MDCNYCQKNIIPFIEKSSGVDAEKMRIHMQQCNDCRKVFEEMLEYWQIIELEKKLKSNPFMATNVIQRIESKKTELERSYFRILQPALITFILIIAVYAGILLGNNYNRISQNSQLDETYFVNELYQENLELTILTDIENE